MISIHAKKMDYIKGGPGKSEFVAAITQNSPGNLQNTRTAEHRNL